MFDADGRGPGSGFTFQPGLDNDNPCICCILAAAVPWTIIILAWLRSPLEMELPNGTLWRNDSLIYPNGTTVVAELNAEEFIELTTPDLPFYMNLFFAFTSTILTLVVFKPPKVKPSAVIAADRLELARMWAKWLVTQGVRSVFIGLAYFYIHEDTVRVHILWSAVKCNWSQRFLLIGALLANSKNLSAGMKMIGINQVFQCRADRMMREAQQETHTDDAGDTAGDAGAEYINPIDLMQETQGTMATSYMMLFAITPYGLVLIAVFWVYVPAIIAYLWFFIPLVYIFSLVISKFIVPRFLVYFYPGTPHQQAQSLVRADDVEFDGSGKSVDTIMHWEADDDTVYQRTGTDLRGWTSYFACAICATVVVQLGGLLGWRLYDLQGYFASFVLTLTERHYWIYLADVETNIHSKIALINYLCA
jgi:hypothetical protein